MKTKRILGLVLALSLAVSTMAMAAWAEDDTTAGDDTTTAAADTTTDADDDDGDDDATADATADAAATTTTDAAPATTTAAPVAPAAPAAPVTPAKTYDPEVNTLEFEMENGTLKGMIDGKKLTDMTAKSGEMEVGMSTDGRLWVTTDTATKKIVAIDEEKPVVLVVTGEIGYFTVDPTFTGTITVDEDCTITTAILPYSGTTTVYGKINVLSVKNNARVVAAKGSELGTVYLYNVTSTLSMRQGSKAAYVKTNYRNDNVTGKAYITSIADFT